MLYSSYTYGSLAPLKICYPYGCAGSSPAIRTIIATFCLLLAACAPDDARRGDQGRTDTLVRLSDNEVRSLDPHKVSDLSSLRVAADQFTGLVQFDGGGRTIPGLAGPPTVSADGLRWVFPLYSGLRFSDDARLTVSDVTGSFARLRDDATASPTASLFAPIASVKSGTGNQIVVTLRHAYPQLPSLLAHPAMAVLPMHRIAARGEAWTSDRPLVTSGPYRATDWKLNEALTLQRNPNRQASIAMPPAIVWRPVDDPLAALRMFRAGEADTVSDFPASRAATLTAQFGQSVRTAPYLGSYYLAFNTRRPPFDDVRVRRALSLSIDRNWIATHIVGAGATPAERIVPPALLPTAAAKPVPFARETRHAEARQLLTAAGYGPARPLTFDIRFNSSAEHRRIAIALQAMWRPLAVEARLFNSEAALHFASLRRGDFAIARSGWIADVPAPENFLGVHRSTAGVSNYSGFADARYDALLAHAEQQAEPKARAAAMRAAEDYLLAQSPVLPIYFYASRSLVAPRVGGWQDNPGNIHPSAFLRIKPAAQPQPQQAHRP